MSARVKKILAISSGGGHWVQLVRLLPAFEGHDVVFATVHSSYQADIREGCFYVVADATRWDRLGLLRLAFQILRILLRERPDVIVSTGAAPGYLALRLGRLLGAKTVWLDSIANVEKLSLSGRKIGPYADLWLTQWTQLAKPQGPRCEGSVL